MTGENGWPQTPEWSLPPRDLDGLSVEIPPNVQLGEN